tara:strand:+ start:6 stop:275 length:270 start_codon:yes stop_codon:yes gene_type:complete
MHHTFFKDHVHINISKKYTESFEELIGDINYVLENDYGITLCYDKNDEHMDHSTKPNEDCFSGFAILYDKQLDELHQKVSDEKEDFDNE